MFLRKKFMHVVLRLIEDVTTISWIFIIFAYFIALIEVGRYSIRLNMHDAWGTVDWYRSTKRRTNVYALTGLTLGGQWTSMDGPFCV